MRHKRLKLIGLLMLGLGLTGLQAQIMFVKETNGTQTAYVMNNIRKMSFSLGNLNITNNDNDSVVYALNGLRHLKYLKIPTDLNKPLLVQNQKIFVFPNPATNELKIDLSGVAKPVGTINIISIEGKTIISQKTTNEMVITLDISSLPKGIYLCRYSNSTEINTVKFIKQ